MIALPAPESLPSSTAPSRREHWPRKPSPSTTRPRAAGDRRHEGVEHETPGAEGRGLLGGLAGQGAVVFDLEGDRADVFFSRS